MTVDTEGKRTPLYAMHCQLGARLIQFGGWEMPVSYSGIIEEHQRVRTHAGLFDVSHMGEIEMSGPRAEAAVQYLTLNDVRSLQTHQLQYSALCNEAGGLLDDLTVCRLAADRFLLVVNAANIDKDFRWITQHLGAGVKAGGLAAACESDPEVVQRHLGRHAGLAGGAFAALNTAFLSDGAFVHVTAGTVMDEPLHLLFLSTLGRAGEPTVSHPRTLVVVDRGASAAVVETYGALGDGVYWTNAVTELVLDDGARAEHSRVQRESRQAYHVATTQSHQNRDSGLALHAIALGGALARHDVNAVLAGAGGHLILNGLYLLAGQQHADHHTVIDHAQHHCESHEYFNGVLDDRAHGVFNGRIIVRPGAQRTDSKQTNNNLLLSEEARADSQPQLEIYADDVKCTHGATLGPIDQTALFYLKSRGLGETEARALLTYGFGTEILGRMRAVEVRAQLDYLVRAWLARSAERRQAA